MLWRKENGAVAAHARQKLLEERNDGKEKRMPRLMRPGTLPRPVSRD
ncbi:MAG TPA: hypothetical protein VF450_05015 [Noviherbaspirillum sp.]